MLSTGEVNARLEFMPGCTHNVTLRVVPELAYPVILGVPWLRYCNLDINWGSAKVHLDCNGTRYKLAVINADNTNTNNNNNT